MAFLFFCCHGFGQTTAEADILKLSSNVFQWETGNQIDSLEKIFDDKFVVVSGTGESLTKKQYMAKLRGGNFVHNSIDVEENTAIVADNTATAIGKGKFTVTVSGNKIALHLSYLEVFTRPNPTRQWKILAMHATVLQH